MHLALYKGPATGLRNKVGRWLVCALTLSRYSHVELVLHGVSYTSSFIDGGVRSKVIDLASGHWDLISIEGDEQLAYDRFFADRGKPYDWLGMLRVSPLLRWLPRRGSSRFCSEEVAWMLGLDDPETFSPAGLARRYRPQ